MGLFSLTFKLQKIRIQHKLNAISLRLNKLTKLIGQQQKAVKQQSKLFAQGLMSNSIFEGYSFGATKEEFVTNYINSMYGTLGKTTAGKELPQNLQFDMQKRMEAIAAYNETKANADAYAEAMIDEENDALLQAYRQEEEDLTIEQGTLKEQEMICDNAIKQGEKMDKDSIDMMTGGSHG